VIFLQQHNYYKLEQAECIEMQSAAAVSSSQITAPTAAVFTYCYVACILLYSDLFFFHHAVSMQLCVALICYSNVEIVIVQ